MKIHSRRSFLKVASGSAAYLGMGGALTGLTAAQAADVSGYKALVCVFFFGGLDSYDTVYPYDQSSYDDLVSARQSIMADYEGARSRAQLLPLTLQNQSAFGPREFALPQQFSGMHSLFNQGRAAIIGNVGPLMRPTTRTQYENRTVPVPPRLFSHNDQQSTWQASAPEGAQFGWGGRFADAAIAASGGQGATFQAITTSGNELFLTGDTASPYQVSTGEGASVRILNELNDQRWSEQGETLYQAARQHFRAANFNSTNLIRQDMGNAVRSAFDANELYNNVLAGQDRVTTDFPSNNLGRQLEAVAETIAVRNELQVSRQVFFVGIGGFDTHSGQANRLTDLQTRIDESVVAFYNAMVELGISSDVTLFTASDFGRTLVANGDGTDHGWGAHHFVVGGAVNGGRIYGTMPETRLNTEYDVEGGRLLPTTSVEEFAAPLGRWFGLSQTELDLALPGLTNFSSRPDLNFMSGAGT